jgi:hypothetical protein
VYRLNAAHREELRTIGREGKESVLKQYTENIVVRRVIDTVPLLKGKQDPTKEDVRIKG